MSQRKSGFARKDFDEYSTPTWVTQVLISHLPPHVKTIWEPACGNGQMVEAFRDAGYDILATDIQQGIDFFEEKPRANIDLICTNPPFNASEEFIKKALQLSAPNGMVAMLLRTDYDHAKSRRHLFKDCPQFSMQIKLLSRIVWFEPAVASPSQNHSWFVWDWKHKGLPVENRAGLPTVNYGP